MNYVKWTQNVIDHLEDRIDGCDDEWKVDEQGLVLTYLDIIFDEIGYPGAETKKLVRQDMKNGYLGNILYKGIRRELAECGVNTEHLDNTKVGNLYCKLFVNTVMHLADMECRIQRCC